jgi:hypothetical protein
MLRHNEIGAQISGGVYWGTYFAVADFQGHVINGVQSSGVVAICTATLIFRGRILGSHDK